MLKAIPGISKKVLVVLIAALFLASMVFFVSPGKIHADPIDPEDWATPLLGYDPPGGDPSTSIWLFNPADTASVWTVRDVTLSMLAKTVSFCLMEQ